MKQREVAEKKQIVILGGGFAGVRAALDLNNYLHDDNRFEIILVDRKDYQTFYAGLFEAATMEHGVIEAKKVKRTVTIPFVDIFRGTKVKIFKAYVDRIDLTDGKVITDLRILPFDYLVVALGSVPDFFGIPNLDKYGFTLKSLEDAIMIRNRIEEIVMKKDSARIIVGGGGFAGVEFAGVLYNLFKHECQHHKKIFKNFKISVVEGGTSFLPGLSEKVAAIIANQLNHMMVETKFSSLITEVGKDYIVLNMKERMDCDLLVWTGGVRSIRLPVDADLERDKKDRTVTTEFLNLKNFPNVFIAGDNLCFIDPRTKKAVAQTSQEAIRHGSLVAKNIFRLIKNKPFLPYSAGPIRFAVPMTEKFAVLYTPNLIITGFLAWTIRKLADLWYFVSILPLRKALKLWLFENNIFMKND